ncbi:MAG TPA: hypothetical protein VGH25_07415, partial [Dongiaceae bacterium]
MYVYGLAGKAIGAERRQGKACEFAQLRQRFSLGGDIGRETLHPDDIADRAIDAGRAGAAGNRQVEGKRRAAGEELRR